MSTRIEKIQNAVEYTCDSTVEHVRSVPLIETYKEGVVWEGVVEVFKINKPPAGRLCYGFNLNGEGDAKIVTVLGTQQIDSPQAAIRVAIVGMRKNGTAALSAKITRPPK